MVRLIVAADVSARLTAVPVRLNRHLAAFLPLIWNWEANQSIFQRPLAWISAIACSGVRTVTPLLGLTARRRRKFCCH